MDSIFERVKAIAKIKEVCGRFGGLKFNRAGRALCPFHQEKTPSFSIKESGNIFKCFGCGESGDAIDFVAKIRNIEPLEAAKLLAEFYGIEGSVGEDRKRDGQRGGKGERPRQGANKGEKRGDAETGESKSKIDKAKIKAYIEESIKRVNETDYFAKRGLSGAAIRRFRLGYDPNKRVIVLPYSPKLDYYQTRSVEGKEFRKPPSEEAGSEPLYGASALSNKGAVFVVESPICAMSIAECGGTAVALCGVANIGKLIRGVRSKKPKCTFVLALDNDEAGRKAQQELANSLFEVNARFIPFNIAGECKDPNELLVKDPEQLTKNIAAAERAAREKYRTDKDSISVGELFAQKHVIPKHAVDNLIVEGLTLLCAPQKIGKSWLVLDLCFKVAAGEDFWAYKTAKRDTLYCSLEDPAWRIKDRVSKLYKDIVPPGNVYFITESDKLGSGFLEHLKEEIDRNPKIGMVVVDTLQRIRKVNAKNNDIYGHDYEELNALKKFAEANKIAMVAVHHTRKMKDDSDPFVNVLGTGGMTGAVDTTLVIMKKKRADKEATLSITGRDVEERDVIIEWGGKGAWRWTMTGNAEEMKEKRAGEEYENDPLVKTVKLLMKENPYGWQGTPSDLLRAVYDATGNAAQSPLTIGAKIQKWNDKLYYDGICHEEKKVRGRKKHVYYKKSHRIPQSSFFDGDGDGENG
jgi:hypothetical protein